MGNPHAVEFVEDIERHALAELGPQLERHPAFPNRVNFHLARIAAWDQPRGGFDAEIWMKTWERGAGMTLACGTGACAVVAAAVRTKRMRGGAALVHLPGGDLAIQYGGKATDEVLMSGPAVEVFEGEWPEPSRNLRERSVLETERLTLRPLEMADAPALVEVCKDREIAANTLTIPFPYSMRDGLRWLSSLQPGRERGEHVCFGICRREDGAVIGTIGLMVQRDHDRAEIGYALAKPLWNRGYATEAVKAVIDYGFKTLGLHRIYASHYGRNPASGRVMIKAGMRPEGTAQGHVKKWGVFEDSVQYAILNPRSKDSKDGSAP
jgi:RimJ/RimL family protein N-acetyltransferase